MLEFDGIKRFSSVYAGAIALAVFVIRKLAGYVEYLFFPVVRANCAFREGVLSFVRMGIAPTKEELQILKRGVSERYAVSPCQMAAVYSILMDIYIRRRCVLRTIAQQRSEGSEPISSIMGKNIAIK